MILIWLLVFLESISSTPKPAPIVNPIETPLPNEVLRKHPDIGAIVPIDNDRALCTTTLTGNKELMTVAHCLLNKDYLGVNFTKSRLVKKNCGGNYVGCIRVSLGDSSTHDYGYYYYDDYGEETNQGKFHNVTDVHIHQSYFDPNEMFFVNDVAILVLEKNVMFNEYVDNANLARANHYLPTQGTIIGFGKVQFDSTASSLNVQYGNVTILNRERCQKVLDNLNSTLSLPPGIICSFGGENGSSPCYGDSGGPLVCEPYRTFCGILSGSDRCKPDVPSIYNSFSYYHDWILDTRQSIKLFPRTRLSVSLWQVQTYSLTGIILTPQEFFMKLKFNDEYVHLFITTLGQVPLQGFTFEMLSLSSTNWNTEHDHMFQVKKAEICDCNSEQEEVMVHDLDGIGQLIVLCSQKPYLYQLNLASFIRFGDEKRVKSVIKMFAEQVLRAMGNHHQFSLSSSYQNYVGVYFAVDVAGLKIDKNSDMTHDDKELPALSASDTFPFVASSANAIFFKTNLYNSTPLTQGQFMQKLKEDEQFTKAMIERLKEVPFQDFSLTFRKFEKARWNSTEYDYMFQVERQKVLNQDCGPEDDFKVIKKETNDVLVVPCLNLKETKPFRFASFIRSGNEDKVVELFQKMATTVLSLGMENIDGRYVSSSFDNTPGVYLIIK